MGALSYGDSGPSALGAAATQADAGTAHRMPAVTQRRTHHFRLLLAFALGCACSLALAQSRQGRSASAEVMDGLAALRAGGCDGHAGTPARLRWKPELSDSARLLAQGVPAQDALRRSGYRPTRLFQAHLDGHRSPDGVLRTVAREYCRQLTDPDLKEAGLHRRGQSWWILLAAPFEPPPPSAAAAVARQVLAHSNEARARPRRCGDEFFPASGPLRLDVQLAAAATAHAQDMARHGFVRHEGSDGSSPGERATRAGYRWRSIAENVAGGQTTARQVVQEWLRSPVHCAALMRPDLTEMGIAYAVDLDGEAGIYWSQKLARPLQR